MTGSGPAVLSQPVADRPETEVIETRFGKVTVYRKNPIIFPNGMLGMPDKMQFCMTNFPSPKLERFKLMQSLEDPALSFITLPVEAENSLVNRADVEQAAKDLEIPVAQLALLFIVSVHRDATGMKLSVNARAPVFLHTGKRVASQYVFANSRYEIRHMITL